MYLCELDKDWRLRQEELYCGRDDYPAVAGRRDGWMDVASLPCDAHVPLIAAGVIEEPLVADHCFKSQWMEGKSWWFKKTFTAGAALLATDNSELVMEGLDAHADIFLNDTYLGHHPSAMYPFRQDVRDRLREGENVLVVRLTTGSEYYSDLDLTKIKDFISCEYKRGRAPRGDDRRAMLRKPQYVYGWDWTPRLATCGIMGDARIEAYRGLAIRHVKFTTRELRPEAASVRVEVELENLCIINTLDATLRLAISLDGAPAGALQQDLFLTSGLNYVAFDLDIARPALWWPNGMGDQPLYQVDVAAESPAGYADARRIHAGIRTVRLNTERLDAANRRFAFEINGVRIFGKGGNWETPDSLYGRVTDAKYEALVQEAAEAHFNMLRVNGCNAYERDFFYDCCDRYGILVWQDFAFSCAAYPDELEWFRREAEQEVAYQGRRLANHPCLALWCGNNECQGHLVTYREKSYWAGARKPASSAGMALYNVSMPRILHTITPEIPYWNSSPYGGEEDMDSSAYGDRHHWDCYMSREMSERITPEQYDKIACKFVSEFGCAGPTGKDTLSRYFGGEPVEMDSPIWKLHTNTFEKGTTKAALQKHYADPATLSLDEYLLYAGLFQGVMLGYALDAMRCAADNAGALIWSYNDAWGEIGWSIVDYYVNRKIAYYFVKRAFAPARLILRQRAGGVHILALNDSPHRLEFELEYGYMTFVGQAHDLERHALVVPPYGRASIVTRPAGHDPTLGVTFARPIHQAAILPAVLRRADYRALQLPPATLSISDVQAGGDTIAFTVSSDTYAHGVHFGLDDRAHLSDAYFDLLPGEARRVVVTPGAAPIYPHDLRAGHAGRPLAMPHTEIHP